MASPTPGATGTRWSRRSAERYRALAPDLRGHGTASTPDAGHARGGASPTSARVAPGALRARRVLDGRPRRAARRARAPRAGRAARAGRGEPGDRRPVASARRAAPPTSALADEIERSSDRGVRRRGGRRRRCSPASRRGARPPSRRPPAQRRRPAWPGAARARHRRDGAAVGPAGRADDAGGAGRGGARREVPGDRGADGGGATRSEVVLVPGAGHAVHLEAPGAVAAVIAGAG